MTSATGERICGMPGCGQSLAGMRRDARYCSAVCRTADGRRRAEPNRIRVRQQPAVTAPGIPGPVRAWEPPGEPRPTCPTAEPCPGCGEPLTAGPRGTWRACGPCHVLVTPAAVQAPYARGDSAPQRQVLSQRERDLAALAIARRKGVMLAQLDALAGDDRLAAESRPTVEWFRDEVKAATTDGRLDELAALLPQAGIRRRHWWQGQPAAIPPPGWDDEDDAGGEDQAGEDDGHPAVAAAARPVLAIVPSGELAAADALDALGWRLSPAAAGCQVTEAGQRCGAEPRHCIRGRYVRDAWICDPHYYAVCRIIRAAARPA